MIHQTLLRRAVAGRDSVLIEFVDTIAPAILTKFATVPALGGSDQRRVLDDECLPAGIPRIPPEALARFSQKNDQSMVTHILNGIFAGMRLAEKLPPGKAMSDGEKRLWLLGYVVHDYTKVYGVKVSAGELSLIREAITCLGQALNFAAFLPGWQTYLDDIAWLAQNTQTVEGANLNMRDFTGLKTHPRRLEILRMLSSIADILVHIESPADVAHRGSDGRDRATNLQEKLTILFGAEHAPRLTYHRLTEVRGLISNLINNAVMEMLQAQGYEPFLFFPNGVVYLINPGTATEENIERAADMVWNKIVDLISESDFGVRRAGTGFIPSSALFELSGLAGVLEAGRRKATNIVNSHATSRLYGFLTGRSDNDLLQELGDKELVKDTQAQLVEEQKLPNDVRVDRLGEYLTFLYRTIRDAFPKAPDPATLLLELLILNEDITAEEATKNKGGNYFGWFYVAARYVQTHPDIDESQLDDQMAILGVCVLSFYDGFSGQQKTSTTIETSLKDYVNTHVELYSFDVTKDLSARFGAELTNYLESKQRRQAICSLCSSLYTAVEQEAEEVPFSNQQYSNKNPLASSKVKRGVCPMCRLEMILRRVTQPALDEGDKPIQLYLYPTYFFTPETAQVIKLFLNEFEDLNLSPFSETSLVRHMRKEGYQTESLLNYDQFLVEPGSEPLTLRRMLIQAPAYSEKDFAGLFLFSLKPKKPPAPKKVTDTDAWVLPTLYGLALPLLLNVKTVVTSSFMPIFDTGADFRETVVLDAPHGFTRHVLGRDRFRVDEVEAYLMRLLHLYDLHLDVFAEPTDLHWPQLNAVVKDIATDPLYVFAYYERKIRSEKQRSKAKKGGKESPASGIPVWDLQRYVQIYHVLGGTPNMGLIGELVDAYATFYRTAKLDSAYGVLRPLGTALDVIMKSDPKTEREDLVLMVAGTVNDDIDRVRSGQADGWIPLKTEGPEQQWFPLLREKIEAFSILCVNKLFAEYCQGDRAILRERANRIRSAANFYYQQQYSRNN